MLAIICGRIEVSSHAVRIQPGDGLGDRILTRKLAGSATVGTKAGEQVGSNDNVALGGEFIGHLLGPVAQAENLVDQDNDRSFGLHFRVDNEGLDRPVAMLDGNVFAMAGRRFEARFRPILSVSVPRRKRQKQSSSGKSGSLGKG